MEEEEEEKIIELVFKSSECLEYYDWNEWKCRILF